MSDRSATRQRLVDMRERLLGNLDSQISAGDLALLAGVNAGLLALDAGRIDGGRHDCPEVCTAGNPRHRGAHQETNMSNPGIVKFIMESNPTDRADLECRVNAAYPNAGRRAFLSAMELARLTVRKADAELEQKAQRHPEHAALIARSRERHAALIAAMRW